MTNRGGIGFALFLSALAMRPDPEAKLPENPEGRALSYLVREVPKWSAENKCYSCHNNGDAARALYRAVQLGYSLPKGALADTSAWLKQPQGWDHNGGEGPSSDKKLARLQFAAALTEAADAGTVNNQKALKDAATLVAELQHEDGAWHVAGDDAVGSPATHGRALATALARRTLQKANRDHYRASLAKAEAWLVREPAKTVLDSAAILLALGEDISPEADGQRERCLAIIRAGHTQPGGWGPTVKEPPEVFDTAIVVLGLAAQRNAKELQPLIRRGRTYLIASQKPDGSWPETTRPSGNVSYAQRLSTAGWATMALLATREGKP